MTGISFLDRLSLLLSSSTSFLLVLLMNIHCVLYQVWESLLVSFDLEQPEFEKRRAGGQIRRGGEIEVCKIMKWGVNHIA